MTKTQIATGAQTVTTAGTPVRLCATTTVVDSVFIQPRKNATTANTGDIYIGSSAIAANNKLVMPTGSAGITFTAQENKLIDLSKIYIDAASDGDGVTFGTLS